MTPSQVLTPKRPLPRTSGVPHGRDLRWWSGAIRSESLVHNGSGCQGGRFGHGVVKGDLIYECSWNKNVIRHYFFWFPSYIYVTTSYTPGKSLVAQVRLSFTCFLLTLVQPWVGGVSREVINVGKKPELSRLNQFFFGRSKYLSAQKPCGSVSLFPQKKHSRPLVYK